ncbi:MAG TPA: amidohydrolase family protein [Candidatus Dormibacteraeota bacterium]|nr:amidohydrolase family protein [Candidatus Dormibacteraeota bacterium]
MKKQQASPRVVAGWLVAAAMAMGILSSDATLTRATVMPQSIGGQDKDKKDQKLDEKKEEKKDEKKGLPLKPERKISFSTDEGTWLSLDVSPDGKTIVFELLGDLYTIPIEGGQAKLISGGMAFDSQPKFSPDGQWIAFISDREGSENLWIIHPDGTAVKQVTKNTADDFTSPSWAPDGKYIFASKAPFGIGAHEIWMYHVEGGTGVQITKSKPAPTTPRKERHNAMGVVASADGKYLYYAVRQGPFSYNAQFPLWKIARRDRKTGDEDQLIDQVESAFRPLLSSDGKQLLYATRYETETGLRLRNLETGEDRWVKYPVTRDDQESLFTRDVFPGYAFLPGAKEIVYNQDGKIKRLDLTSGTEKVIPFTAQVTQDLGPKLDFPQKVEEGPLKVRLIMDPVESPDGKKLAFSAMTHLYTMDLPSGKPQRLGTGNEREFQPAWSPDGKSIAYVTWSSAGGQLWKVSAAGGTPVQLSKTPAVYSNPAWSPDGAKIVLLRGNAYDRENSEFDGGQTGNADLVWIPSDGGEPNLILPARGAGGPHFTHDKDRVYVYTPQGLVSLRYDGTDRRTHIVVKGQGLYFFEEPIPADDVQPSPDGQWVLAHVMNQLYVIAMPVVGGETPTVNVMTASVPVKRLTDIGADYFAWADDGKTITWAIGSSLFREPLSAVSFEPPKDEKKDADKKDPDKKDGDAKDASENDAEHQQPARQVANNLQAQKDEKKEDKKNDKKDEKKEPKKLKEEEKNVEEIPVVLEVPRKTPKGKIVLRGATVVTMKGPNGDEILKNADIVIENNRIKSVGARGSIPAGAKLFDVKGKTIVPGFIDTHAHWTEIRRGILDTQNWSFLANLAYGVTSGLDVQTGSNDMFAYQDLADSGDIIGLRAFSTGPGVFSDNNFQSMEEVKGVLLKYEKYYGTHNIKSYIVGNRKQRQYMVQAAKELEMMPTAEGGLDLKLDLTHLIDGFHGNEHTLPITPLYKDVIQMFAQSGIAETPTLIVNYGGPFGENYWYENSDVHDDVKLNHFTPHRIIDQKTKRRPEWFRKDEYAFPKLAAQMTKLQRAGGLVGVGSHGQLQGLGYHWEMWMLASGGMTPLEVLRCATLNGSKIIGRPQDLGSIEPGKLADLIILDKNPLDDIHNTNTVRWVMKNGELFEGDTLNQVWPEQKNLAPLWFWNNYDAPKPGEPLSYGPTKQP